MQPSWLLRAQRMQEHVRSVFSEISQKMVISDELDEKRPGTGTCEDLDGTLEHLVEPHGVEAVEADAAEAVEPEHRRQQRRGRVRQLAPAHPPEVY